MSGTMSDILLLGVAIGVILGVGLDRAVLLPLARDLVRHGRR